MYVDLTKTLRLLFGVLWMAQKGVAATTESYSKILPQARIVGGSNAKEGQFPHQVSIRQNGVHICGGSIISANYIVTAAHCIGAEASRLSIRAGSVLINRGGQIVSVAEVIVHPSFNLSNFDGDIAVLKLSNSLKFNNQVKSVALAKQAPPTGALVVSSGWGRLSRGGLTPQVLQFITFRAMSYDDCSYYLPWIATSVICAAHPLGQGVCHGDSGGPAIYNNQLVGVTNFVVNGCATNSPDGFANVAYQLDWLKKNSDVQ